MSAVSSESHEPAVEPGQPAAGQADFGANEWLVEELYQRYLSDPGTGTGTGARAGSAGSSSSSGSAGPSGRSGHAAPARFPQPGSAAAASPSC